WNWTLFGFPIEEATVPFEAFVLAASALLYSVSRRVADAPAREGAAGRPDPLPGLQPARATTPAPALALAAASGAILAPPRELGARPRAAPARTQPFLAASYRSGRAGLGRAWDGLRLRLARAWAGARSLAGRVYAAIVRGGGWAYGGMRRA